MDNKKFKELKERVKKWDEEATKAGCKCLPEMQVYGCDAGDKCIHFFKP